MGILEEIGQLRNQGLAENEIIGNLQERGYAPKDINDALSRMQIKNAISGEESPSEEYTPQPETAEAQPQQYATQEYYPQQGYENYAAESSSSDTIIEIAEQVFLEKSKKMQSQVSEFSEFKTLSETKVENIAERLKRIETTLDKLQLAILDKVGSYGSTLQSIKKEMEMIEDNLGKPKKSSKK